MGFQIVYSQKQELIITLEVDILTSQPPTVLDSLFPSLGESRRFPKLQYVKEEIVKSKEDNFNNDTTLDLGSILRTHKQLLTYR